MLGGWPRRLFNSLAAEGREIGSEKDSTYFPFLKIQDNHWPLLSAELVFLRLAIALLSFLLTCLNPLNFLPGGISPFAPERCLVCAPKDLAPSSPAQSPNISPTHVTLTGGVPKDAALSIAAAAGRDGAKQRKESGQKGPKIRRPCPEETASHLSVMSYFWFFE